MTYSRFQIDVEIGVGASPSSSSLGPRMRPLSVEAVESPYPPVGRVYSPVASPSSSTFLRTRGKYPAPSSCLPHPLLGIYPGRTIGPAFQSSPGPAAPVLTRTSSLLHGTHRPFCLTHLGHLGPLPLSFSSNKFIHL